jgi:hypothetical protein
MSPTQIPLMAVEDLLPGAMAVGGQFHLQAEAVAVAEAAALLPPLPSGHISTPML